jgi:hypothetical protein
VVRGNFRSKSTGATALTEYGKGKTASLLRVAVTTVSGNCEGVGAESAVTAAGSAFVAAGLSAREETTVSHEQAKAADKISAPCTACVMPGQRMDKRMLESSGKMGVFPVTLRSAHPTPIVR